MQVTGQQWQRKPPSWGGRCFSLLVVGCIALVAVAARSAGIDYALMMPRASSSLLLDIAIAGERLVAVGERGHIVYSQDGGGSWVQARVPTSVMLTRVFFVSDTTGWAVGHDGNILVSTDGGVNWTLQRDGLSDQGRINEERVALARARVNELQEQLRGALPEAGDELAGVLENAQHDLQIAQEVLGEPIYPPPLMDIWFADTEQGWASGAFGTLLHTSNGGRSWSDWSYKVDNPEGLHFNGVAGDSTGTLYLASEWGYVFRSGSNGELWQAVETGYDGSFFGILVNPVSDTVFAYGLLGTIYRSTDHGQTWEEVESKTRQSLFGAAVGADGAVVFVGLNGAAVLSTDDGESFLNLQQQSRRGLYGVTPTRAGQFMAIGEGGSTRISAGPVSGR